TAVQTGVDDSQVLSVQNPSLTFQFAVQPGSPPAGRPNAVYTWGYNVNIQACLYSGEVPGFGGAQDTGEDCSGLRPPSANTTATHWYVIGQEADAGLELTSGTKPHS